MAKVANLCPEWQGLGLGLGAVLPVEAHFYFFGDFLPEHLRDLDAMIGRPHEELPAQEDALIGQNLKDTTKQAALGFAVYGQVAFGADGIFARRIQRNRRNQLALK